MHINFTADVIPSAITANIIRIRHLTIFNKNFYKVIVSLYLLFITAHSVPAIRTGGTYIITILHQNIVIAGELFFDIIKILAKLFAVTLTLISWQTHKVMISKSYHLTNLFNLFTSSAAAAIFTVSGRRNGNTHQPNI